MVVLRRLDGLDLDDASALLVVGAGLAGSGACSVIRLSIEGSGEGSGKYAFKTS